MESSEHPFPIRNRGVASTLGPPLEGLEEAERGGRLGSRDRQQGSLWGSRDMQDPAAAAAAAAAANAGPRAGDLNQQPLGCVLSSKVVCVLVLGNLQSYVFFC
jgi:hypothetical protein